jgi:hypothetical protein
MTWIAVSYLLTPSDTIAGFILKFILAGFATYLFYALVWAVGAKILWLVFGSRFSESTLAWHALWLIIELSPDFALSNLKHRKSLLRRIRALSRSTILLSYLYSLNFAL